MIIRADNLDVKKYGSRSYIAKITNKGKSKRDIVGGVFSIDEIRQWKQMVIAFERDIKEL